MKQKGFTLIELLVVIAIIGLLASVVLLALNDSRQKSRVAKRVADLAQIAKALEVYYNDNNHYPISGTTNSVCTGAGTYNQVSANNVIPGLVPNYISSIPVDPSSDGVTKNCYIYYPNSSNNGTDYKFLDNNITDMTATQIKQYPSLVDPCRNNNAEPAACGWVSGNDPANAWSIYSPGAHDL